MLTSRGAWGSSISICRHADKIFPSFMVFRKHAKCTLLYIIPLNHTQHTYIAYAHVHTYMYMYTHVQWEHTEKSHLKQSVLVEFCKAGCLAQSNTTDSTGKRCRSWWHPLTLLTLVAPTPLQTYMYTWNLNQITLSHSLSLYLLFPYQLLVSPFLQSYLLQIWCANSRMGSLCWVLYILQLCL